MRSFHPSSSRRFGNSPISFLGHPYALARTSLLRHLRDFISPLGQNQVILDVGCGDMPYKGLFDHPKTYHGLEIDYPGNRNKKCATHWYSGDILPFSDQSYDIVLCSQVLEHSFNPEQLLAEMYRVLRPGGFVVLSIPFLWPEHEMPFDSQRYTSPGLKSILEKVGFTKVTLKKTNPGLSALMQLGIEWVESSYRNSPCSKKKLIRPLLIILYVVMNLVGLLYREFPTVKRSRRDPELFLDLCILATK